MPGAYPKGGYPPLFMTISSDRKVEKEKARQGFLAGLRFDLFDGA